MKKLFFTLIAAAMFFTLSADTPKRGIVVFRFDDNKSGELWRELNGVFRKHGFNFSLAVCPLSLKTDSDQAKALKELQSVGNEIMDHTPTHSNMKISFSNSVEAEKYALHPGVDHIEKSVVCLKLVFDPDYPHNKELDITVKDNRIISPDDEVKKHLRGQNYLVFPDGKIYGVDFRNGIYTICSAWGTACKVKDTENIRVIRSDRFGVQTSDDGLRLLAEVSKREFERLQLDRPTCYVVAGGWGCYPHQKSLMRVFGREYGYTCGTAVNYWFGVYDRPDRESGRFALACEWNSPENRSVDEMKKMIADYMAKNRVVPIISHLWFNRVPGGKTELLRRYDELLAFLKQKNIPVMTMSQAAEVLYDGKADKSYNVMPRLDVDLDGDGYPDGYEKVSGVKASGGKLFRADAGKLFEINKLTGITPGKNLFSCRVNGAEGTEITLETTLYKASYPVPERKLAPLKKIVKKSGEIITFELDIPASSPGTGLKMFSSQPVEIEQPSLSYKL